MRPTGEVLSNLLRQVQELARVELRLIVAEIGERTARVPSSLAALVVGVALIPVAFGVLLVAAALFLARFGLPLDLAFLVVGVITILVSFVCLRLGAAGLKPSRLAPVKSLSQISSLFGGM